MYTKNEVNKLINLTMWDINYKPPGFSSNKISKFVKICYFKSRYRYLRGKERIHIEVKHGLDDGEDGEDNGGHGDGGEAGHPVYHASPDYHQIRYAWTLFTQN